MAINLRVSFNPYSGDNGLVGFANVIFNGEYALEGVKIREGKYGAIVELPQYSISRKDENGNPVKDQSGKQLYDYKDVLHPTSPEVNAAFSKLIKQEYINVRNGKSSPKGGTDYQMDGSFEISNVYVTPLDREDNLVGLGTVHLGNKFVFDKVRIKEGDKGLFIEGPMYRTTKKDDNGDPLVNDKGENEFEYKAYFHAITTEAYEKLRDCVVDALNKKASYGQKQTAEQALGNNNAADDFIPFIENNQGQGR